MLRTEVDSNEINHRIEKIGMLVGLFSEDGKADAESKFEFILMSAANNQHRQWRNHDLWSLICDYNEAKRAGNFVNRLIALNEIARDHISKIPGERSGFYKEKEAILQNLANIGKLASVSDQQDKEAARQFINLLESLANSNQGEAIVLLAEVSNYINDQIKKEKLKENFNELAVYKECIKEINLRLTTQYSASLVNLESQLLSYKEYLEGLMNLTSLKSDPQIKERIKECQKLITSAKDTKIDTISKIAILSSGLKKMDVELTVTLKGDQPVSVQKCSEYNTGSIASAFNQLLELIGKHYPSVLQHKMGISQTLLDANVTQDLRQAIRPR